mmetsp:Transcript_124591/g.346978  ORF Transcript_124591/g.346978 Transcript_124591/m.346978 type:complete len:89 (-) Transcript_124591:1036-1302(-)
MARGERGGVGVLMDLTATESAKAPAAPIGTALATPAGLRGSAAAAIPVSAAELAKGFGATALLALAAGRDFTAGTAFTVASEIGGVAA